MSLALTGTHASGKTTLAERLTRPLPNYTIIDEPWYLLESQGHHFSDPPTPEDFELQLACSLDTIEAATGHCIFDRSPIDFLAYLLAGLGHTAVDFDRWIPRGRMDERLRELLEEDPWKLGARVLEVRGSVDERARQVLEHLR